MERTEIPLSWRLVLVPGACLCPGRPTVVWPHDRTHVHTRPSPHRQSPKARNNNRPLWILIVGALALVAVLVVALLLNDDDDAGTFEVVADCS